MCNVYWLLADDTEKEGVWERNTAAATEDQDAMKDNREWHETWPRIDMSRVRHVRGLTCPGFDMSRVRHVRGLTWPGIDI